MNLTAEQREEIRDLFSKEPLSDGHLQQIGEKFVSKKECNKNVTEVNNNLGKNYTRFGILETKVSAILWLIGIEVVAIVGVLVNNILR